MGPVCYVFPKTGDKRRTSRGRPWWEGGRAKAVELFCLPAVAEVPAVENATLVVRTLGIFVLQKEKSGRVDL